MIESMQLIYTCDHVIDSVTTIFAVDKIIRRDLEDIDIVCKDFIIKDVYSVYYEDQNGKRTYYFADTDFVIIPTDMIQWLQNGRKPPANEQYSIEYLKSQRTIIKYPQEACPRCDGNGWYIDLVNVTGASMGKLAGMDKITQDFIKLLLTNNSGGNDLVSFVGKESYSDTADKITTFIKQCEEQYLKRQASMSADITEIQDSDLLEKVIILEVEYDQDLGGYFIDLILRTKAGTTSQVGLKV